MGFWNTIGSWIGIKSQEEKEDEYRRGYKGKANNANMPFYRYNASQQDQDKDDYDKPFILVDKNIYDDAQSYVNDLVSKNNWNFNDLEKQQLTMRKIFKDTYGAEDAKLYEQNFINNGGSTEELIKNELSLINQKKIGDYFEGSKRKDEIFSMQPKAIAALMGTNYKTADRIKELADQEAKEYADKKASTISGFNMTRNEIWQNQYDEAYQKAKNKMLDENEKAMQFAKRVNSREIERAVNELDNVEEIKNDIASKNSPEQIDQEFHRIASKISGLYAGTGSEEYRNKWNHDDLWDSIEGSDNYDKRLDMLANFKAIAQVDGEAAYTYLNDALQKEAYDNTNILYGIAKFGRHFGTTASGMIGAALYNAAQSLEYRINSALYGTKEADRIQGNYNLGYTADWTEEKENSEVEKAKQQGASEKEIQAIHDKYKRPFWGTVKYWNDVSQYGTWDPNLHKDIQENQQGVSQYSWVQAPGGLNWKNYIQEGADMTAQLAGQFGTGALVKAPFNLLTRGAANLAKLGVTVDKLGKIQKGINGLGETLAITIPSYGIAGSYSQNNFMQEYEKNLSAIKQSLDPIIKQKLSERLEAAKAGAEDQELRDWWNKSVEEEANKSINTYTETQYVQQMGPEDKTLEKYFTNSPFKEQLEKEFYDTDIYKTAKQNALIAAADGSRQDNTSELIKYGAFNALFRRYIMPKSVAADLSRRVQKAKNFTASTANKTVNFVKGKGFKAPNYGELGKIKQTSAEGIYSLEQPAWNGWRGAINSVIWGGGFTNYTDELQSAWSQWWNDEEFKELCKESFDQMADDAETSPSNILNLATQAYSFVQAMNDGFEMGFDEEGYNDSFFKTIAQTAATRSSIDAFVIGALGSLMPGLNYRNFEARLDGSYTGEKRYNPITGLYEGSNINPVTGDFSPLNWRSRLIGNRGIFDWGINQARMQEMSEYNRKEHHLQSFNQGLKDIVWAYINTDAPDLYDLFDAEQSYLEAETPEEQMAIKAGQGFKLAAFVSKAQKLIGDQSSDINKLLDRIEEISQSEVSDISDEEIAGHLDQAMKVEKLNAENDKHQRRIEELKQEIKQQYIDGAKDWLEKKKQIQDVYNKIDETFGWALTEDEKYDRAFKEINNPVWEQAANDIEKSLTGESSYTDVNTNPTPAHDFRTKEQVEEWLNGKPAKDGKEPQKGAIEQLEEVKKEQKVQKEVLKKVNHILDKVSSAQTPEQRESIIEKELAKIKEERVKNSVDQIVHGEIINNTDERGKNQLPFKITQEAIVRKNERYIEGMTRDIDAAKERLKYLKDNPGESSILSASEILKLSPFERLYMILNKKEYNSAQRKELTEAMRTMRTNYRAKNEGNLSEKNLIKLLKRQANIISNVEINNSILSNQNEYIFTAKADRIAAVNRAKQRMLSDFIPRVKNYMQQMKSSSEVYAYIYKMKNSGSYTAGSFDQFLDYFKKRQSPKLEHVTRVIDSMNRAKKFVSDNFSGDNTSEEDIKLLEAFVFAAIEKDKEISKEQEESRADKAARLEDTKHNIERNRAIDILANLDFSYSDVVKETQNIVSQIENILDKNSPNSLPSTDTLQEALEHAVQNQNLKLSKEAEQKNNKGKKKNNKKASSVSTPAPPTVPPATPTTAPKEPETPKEPVNPKPNVNQEEPAVNNENGTSANQPQTQTTYQKVVEAISNRNSFTLAYLFEKLFKKLDKQLTDDQKAGFLNSTLEKIKTIKFKDYNALAATLKDVLNGMGLESSIKAKLKNFMTISMEDVKEAEKYKDTIYDDVVSGEGLEFVSEDERQHMVIPTEGVMQSANLIHLSQYEKDKKNGIWHTFKSFGGREALRKLKPNAKIYFLRQTVGGESEIWLAVEDPNSNTAINGYQVVGLLSKNSTNDILQSQYSKVEGLHKSDSDGWEIIQKDNKPLTAKVLQKYSARPTVLKKEGTTEADNKYDDYVHTSIVTLFEEEGIPREKRLEALLDPLQTVQDETAEGKKYLKYRNRPLQTKRVNETLNKSGQPLQANLNVSNFNQTLRAAADIIKKFLEDTSSGSLTDVLTAPLGESERTEKLATVARNFKSALGKYLHLPNNYGFKFIPEGYSVLGQKYSISLVKTNPTTGEETEIVKLLDFQKESGGNTETIKGVLRTSESLGGAYDEGGVINRILTKLIFDDSNNFRTKEEDPNNEPLVMWQIDHKGVMEETDESIRKKEVGRWLEDDLLVTSHLFLHPQVAGFTFEDPLLNSIDQAPQSIPEPQVPTSAEPNVLPEQPGSKNVGGLPEAKVDQVKKKMKENFQRFQKENFTKDLVINTFSRVTNLVGKLTDRLEKSARALVFPTGNNLDTFYRKIITNEINKNVENGQSSSLDLTAGLAINASSENWVSLYNSFERAKDYIIHNLLKSPTGLEWISLGDSKTQIAAWGSIEVRQFDDAGNVTRVGDLAYRGLLDLLAYDPSDGQYVLFDYKAIRVGDTKVSKGNEDKAAKKKISDNKLSWARQLNLYVKALESTYDIKIKGAYIIPTRAKYPWDYAPENTKSIQSNLNTRKYRSVKNGNWERIQVSEGEGQPYVNVSPTEYSYELHTEDITENLLGYTNTRDGEFLDWINADQLNDNTKIDTNTGEEYVVNNDIVKVKWRDEQSGSEENNTPTSPTVAASRNTALNNKNIPKQRKPMPRRSNGQNQSNTQKQSTKSAVSSALEQLRNNCK